MNLYSILRHGPFASTDFSHLIEGVNGFYACCTLTVCHDIFWKILTFFNCYFLTSFFFNWIFQIILHYSYLLYISLAIKRDESSKTSPGPRFIIKIQKSFKGISLLEIAGENMKEKKVVKSLLYVKRRCNSSGQLSQIAEISLFERKIWKWVV